jgi:hypothetical protein
VALYGYKQEESIVNGAICRSDISTQFYLAKESFTIVPNNTCRWEYQFKMTGTFVAGEHKEAACFERKLRKKSRKCLKFGCVIDLLLPMLYVLTVALITR